MSPSKTEVDLTTWKKRTLNRLRDLHAEAIKLADDLKARGDIPGEKKARFIGIMALKAREGE